MRKIVVALLLSALFISCSKKTPDTPNVIFIYADDLGRGLLSCEGQKIIKTPNIDKLSGRGVRFENVYGCMFCAPARASLLTGYHDLQNDKWKLSRGGVYKKLSVDSTVSAERIQKALDKQYGDIPEDEVFLAQVFQKAGYVTAQVGKLDWGFATTHKQLKRHGWDYYYGYYDHVRCHGYYPPFLFDNGKKVTISGNTEANCGKTYEHDEDGGYAHRWKKEGRAVYSQNIFKDKIIDFIREHKDEKFFIYHPTQLPHGPTAIPEIHQDFANNPNLTEIEKAYASMVKMLDDHVGNIVKELEELDLIDHTIIVFSADNGHEIYYPSKGKLLKPTNKNIITDEVFDNIDTKYYSNTAVDVFNGNDGMAGLKRSNWEGGVRVPLYYYWKGHIEGGRTIDQLVANYDMMATFADLLNVSLPEEKHSKSYWPELQGEKNDSKREYTVFGSYMGAALVTNDGWKLRHYAPKDIFQLYYLPNDYREENNLIAQYPEMFQDLKEKLLKECNDDLHVGHFKGGERVLPNIKLKTI
jgi:arylsulfatase A-like enzyme